MRRRRERVVGLVRGGKDGWGGGQRLRREEERGVQREDERTMGGNSDPGRRILKRGAGGERER